MKRLYRVCDRIAKMRQTRDRATAIHAARLNQDSATAFPRQQNVITIDRERAFPFADVPLTASDRALLEHTAFPFEQDTDLEAFLRRNNLTYALEQYIRAHSPFAA